MANEGLAFEDERNKQRRESLGSEEVSQRCGAIKSVHEVCCFLVSHPERGKDDGQIEQLLRQAEALRENLRKWTWVPTGEGERK
jgi:hypothetical protein